MGFAPVLKKTTCSWKKELAKKKMTHGWPDTNWQSVIGSHVTYINVPSVCIVQYLLFLDSIYQ
jgi:hypothetical protein